MKEQKENKQNERMTWERYMEEFPNCKERRNNVGGVKRNTF